MDGYGYGWDLCVGLFYEHRFAMLIISNLHTLLPHLIIPETHCDGGLGVWDQLINFCVTSVWKVFQVQLIVIMICSTLLKDLHRKVDR